MPTKAKKHVGPRLVKRRAGQTTARGFAPAARPRQHTSKQVTSHSIPSPARRRSSSSAFCRLRRLALGAMKEFKTARVLSVFASAQTARFIWFKLVDSFLDPVVASLPLTPFSGNSTPDTIASHFNAIVVAAVCLYLVKTATVCTDKAPPSAPVLQERTQIKCSVKRALPAATPIVTVFLAFVIGTDADGGFGEDIRNDNLVSDHRNVLRPRWAGIFPSGAMQPASRVVNEPSPELLPELRFIAPGHGTTGTHSIHYVLCRLGLRAQHTRLNCSSRKQGPALVDFKAGPFFAAMKCLERVRTGVFHHNISLDVSTVRAAARHLVVELAAKHLQAVSDYPVCLFYDELAAAAPLAAVLLSTRNATEWALKRRNALVCRETTSEWPITTGPGPILPHPFAFTACAERFLLRSYAQPLRDTSPAFLQISHLQSSAHGIHRLAAGFMAFNEYVRQSATRRGVPFAEVNLFVEAPPAVYDKMQTLLPDAVMRHASEWRQMRGSGRFGATGRSTTQSWNQGQFVRLLNDLNEMATTICFGGRCIEAQLTRAQRDQPTWPKSIQGTLPGNRTQPFTDCCHSCTPESCSNSVGEEQLFIQRILPFIRPESLGAPFYLEMGGNDGLHASNTLHLEHCLGWPGALIEAHPKLFRRLAYNRPAAVSVYSAVSRTTGFVNFTRVALPASGLMKSELASSSQVHSSFSADTQYRNVPSATLASILGYLDVHSLTLFSLDVEDAELEVLRSVDWSKLSVAAMIVEEKGKRTSTSKNNLVRKELFRAGFRYVFSAFDDAFFVHPMHVDLESLMANLATMRLKTSAATTTSNATIRLRVRSSRSTVLSNDQVCGREARHLFPSEAGEHANTGRLF